MALLAHYYDHMTDELNVLKLVIDDLSCVALLAGLTVYILSWVQQSLAHCQLNIARSYGSILAR